MTYFLDAHPNFRSALRVFSYTFLASFVPAILGFLSDLLEWTETDDASFPAVDTLGKAIVAAFIAALAGLIAFVYNKLPIGAASTYGTPLPPPPPPGDGGVAPNFPNEFP
jgi:hypothetical protein